MINQRFEQAKQRANAYVQIARTEVRNPGLVLALSDGQQTLHTQAWGMANLEAEIPLEANALFQIGSISKTFTGVMALCLVEQGVLNLHKPVVETLPWFKVKSPLSDTITPHHLLSHSSGLPYTIDFSPGAWANVYGLRDVELGFDPGTAMHYAEQGFQALTVLVETLTGKTWGQLVTELIFKPLGMDDSSAPITRDLQPLMPQGYRPLYDDRPVLPCHPLMPKQWVEFDSGDGGVASTAEDMCKFMRMLINGGEGPHGRLLSDESYRMMVTPTVPESEYGYGVFAFESEGHRMLGHGGEMPSYETSLLIDLDLGIGQIVMGTQPWPEGLSWKTYTCWRSAYDEAFDLPEEPKQRFPTLLASPRDYNGTYEAVGGGETVELTRVDMEVYLLTQAGVVPLYEREEDVFSANLPGWDRFALEFGRRKDDNVVTHFWHGGTLYANRNYNGPRTWEVPEAWQAYVGHYRTWMVWEPVFRIVLRGDQLVQVLPYADTEPLIPLENGLFKVGEWEKTPERMRFEQVVDGKALRCVFSGVSYYRWFVE